MYRSCHCFPYFDLSTTVQSDNTRLMYGLFNVHIHVWTCTSMRHQDRKGSQVDGGVGFILFLFSSVRAPPQDCRSYIMTYVQADGQY